MSSPEAESAVAALFNEIANLDLEQTDRARTLYLEIRRLQRQMPSSFIVAIGWIIAALKVGRRDEAVGAISHAYGLRTASETMGWGALADTCVFVGQRDRAAELYGRLRTIPGALADNYLSQNAANGALVRGDIEFMRYLSDQDSKVRREVSNARNFLAVIDGYGIADVLDEHQRITSDILGEHRTWASPVMRYEEQDQPSLVIYHCVLGDRSRRAALQAQLIHAYRDHYEKAQKDLSGSLTAILNAVVEAPAMAAPFSVQ